MGHGASRLASDVVVVHVAKGGGRRFTAVPRDAPIYSLLQERGARGGRRCRGRALRRGGVVALYRPGTRAEPLAHVRGGGALAPAEVVQLERLAAAGGYLYADVTKVCVARDFEAIRHCRNHEKNVDAENK